MAEHGDSGRPAAFLDRDGTINEDVEFLRDPGEVRLLPGAAEGVALLKQAGFLAIVVSNQSGVARGLLSEERLGAIHREIQSQLRAAGTSLDAFYYCPHLPEGSVARYAVRCDCRKPEAGLLFRAAREWRVDLARSVMIGDSERDVLAGRQAGCAAALIADTAPTDTVADVVVESLLEAARWAAAREEAT